MNEILVIALIFGMLSIGALLLYVVKVIIGKMEKYFLSTEETLVFIGVTLIAAGWILGVGTLFGAGIGIIFTDWILNWERIVERYRPKKESQNIWKKKCLSSVYFILLDICIQRNCV